MSLYKTLSLWPSDWKTLIASSSEYSRESYLCGMPRPFPSHSARTCRTRHSFNKCLPEQLMVSDFNHLPIICSETFIFPASSFGDENPDAVIAAFSLFPNVGTDKSPLTRVSYRQPVWKVKGDKQKFQKRTRQPFLPATRRFVLPASARLWQDYFREFADVSHVKKFAPSSTGNATVNKGNLA